MAEGKEIHIESEVRQVGDHLACFIPAHEARKMDLAEGEIIDVHIRKRASSPKGLLEETGLAYERFDRNDEGLWDERL